MSLPLGLTLVGAGLAHSLAVTSVAFHERGGYDASLATLLLLGLAVVSFGVLMGGVGLIRERLGSAFPSLLGGSCMSLANLALVPVISDFAARLVVFGSFLAIAPFLIQRQSGEGFGPRTRGDR